MLVSVIIPVYNDGERLALCLQHLQRQTLPPASLEILVVDNGSRDSPLPIVSQFPGARLLSEQRPGSYAARNRGLSEARGELIAFTDADCLPQPHWLAAAIAMLQADPTLDVVGGDIEIFPADPQQPTAVELYDVAFGLPQEKNIREQARCVTANLVTRRSVIERVGPFDDRVLSGSDHEWCNRLQQSGGRVQFCRAALVKHPARRQLGDLLRQSRREVGGRVDRWQQHRGRRSAGHWLWVLLRTGLPNLSKMWRAKSLLAERNYRTLAWLRVLPVILAVQYAKLAESLRKLSGGRSERS